MQFEKGQRRYRWGKRSPRKHFIVLNKRDDVIFNAINRHGPLTVTYLQRFCQQAKTHDSERVLNRRMTQLFHGYCPIPGDHEKHACQSVSFLTRPHGQRSSYTSMFNQIAYELGDEAKIYLRDNDVPINTRGDQFPHRFMNACVSASFDLAHPGFMDARQIINHPSCPEATRNATNPLALPVKRGKQTHLVPDNLFAIDYGGAYRRFVLEADRDSEQVTENNGYNSIGNKILLYEQILQNQVFKKHWGISNISILIVTVNKKHMQSVIEYVQKKIPNEAHRGRFLFKTIAHFGRDWKPPHVYEDILEGWVDGNGKPVSLSTP